MHKFCFQLCFLCFLLSYLLLALVVFEFPAVSVKAATLVEFHDPRLLRFVFIN